VPNRTAIGISLSGGSSTRHGQWLVAEVPGGEADISDRDGHITTIGRIGEAHDWLLQHF
jgi:hypothetical protein